jgi:hypothetical protein
MPLKNLKCRIEVSEGSDGFKITGGPSPNWGSILINPHILKLWSSDVLKPFFSAGFGCLQFFWKRWDGGCRTSRWHQPRPSAGTLISLPCSYASQHFSQQVAKSVSLSRSLHQSAHPSAGSFISQHCPWGGSQCPFVSPTPARYTNQSLFKQVATSVSHALSR